jgi:hypothetical protein
VISAHSEDSYVAFDFFDSCLILFDIERNTDAQRVRVDLGRQAQSCLVADRNRTSSPRVVRSVGVGWWGGWQPRAKVSMMSMRPPQLGQG